MRNIDLNELYGLDILDEADQYVILTQFSGCITDASVINNYNI